MKTLLVTPTKPPLHDDDTQLQGFRNLALAPYIPHLAADDSSASSRGSKSRPWHCQSYTQASQT